MKKIIFSKDFTCDDLNALGLPAKVLAVITHGEEIHLIIDSDNDKTIDETISKIAASFPQINAMKVKEKRNLDKAEEERLKSGTT